MEKLAKNKTAPGRYALLDELRGLDLVSMMLYRACWDLVFLFGVEMKWYAATPGHLCSNPSAGCSSCFPASVCRWGTTLCGAARRSSEPGC